VVLIFFFFLNSTMLSAYITGHKDKFKFFNLLML